MVVIAALAACTASEKGPSEAFFILTWLVTQADFLPASLHEKGNLFFLSSPCLRKAQHLFSLWLPPSFFCDEEEH